MKVELRFCDVNDPHSPPVHEEEMIYDGYPPIPDIGEILGIEENAWIVRRREYSYYRPSLKAQNNDVDVRLTILVDGPFDVATMERKTSGGA